MQRCIFSFCITQENIEIKELPEKHRFGKLCILTDTRTPYHFSQNSRSECVIYGYAVDVFTGDSIDLAQKLNSSCSNIDEIVEYEKRLGGKYVIFYRNEEDCYILGDATCSIPVYYGTGTDGRICTSNPQYLIKHYGLVPDKKLDKIRKSGDISQAMPFDITSYREILQLLPNHYLSFSEAKAIRFINAHEKQAPVTVQEAADRVTPLIDVLTQYYLQQFKIYCPITAGRDSRVVLSFLLTKDKNVACYTIKHVEHSGNEQDLVVPQKLCADNAISHRIVEDIVVPKETKTRVDELLGERNYAQRTLRIAETINQYFGDGAIINGDIIGQVGKCSLHRDIPHCLATPGYFRCKLHNFSRGALTYLKLWLDEIAAGGEKVNTFDLFSIENRMGRWAGQTNLLYHSIGQISLNCFNSRSIIYTWTAVSRSERKQSMVHHILISRKYASLLNTPFEQESNLLVRISKSNGWLYYVASYLKYYIEFFRFIKSGKK